ncbi:sensor kinase CckA [Trichonephila clavata]|uniref:Sensor kinase CckA n=1 Tax=Trichonephila clavata TaxID=2740835 RepID=A0A8X6F454_TRICU|nr:sensor kinase CckA [Trichonephila clavata]
MQAIGQLAGGIAHDFNNILTGIIGFCDLLLLQHSAGDPSFGDIIQIQQNAKRGSNLVRQLLAFSRRQTLQPKIIDVNRTIANLMK